MNWLLACIWMLAAAFPLTDSDIWWHLASGREMVAAGTWLTTDPFTFTATGHPWNNVHWLYQLTTFGVHELAGLWGVWCFHVVAWGVAALVWTRKRMSVQMILVSAVCIIATRYLLLARPIVFSLILIGLQIRVWESNHSSRNKLLLLTVLQILLANMQGLFLLGPFFLFVWMGKDGERSRLLVLWPAFLVLISTIHPNGLSQLLYPLELLHRQLPGNYFALHISENQSPLRTLMENANALPIGEVCALSLVTLLWMISIPKNRGLLLFLPIVMLAWMAERNIVVLFVVLIPLLRDTALPEKLCRGVLAAIVIGFFLAQVQWWKSYDGPVTPHRFPEHVVEWMATHIPDGNRVRVFCESRHGGYLAWKLYPRVLTFIDGRFILRNEAFMRQYLELETNPEQFSAMEKDYSIAWAVLPRTYPSMFQELANWFARNPGWKLEYQDEDALVFRKL